MINTIRTNMFAPSFNTTPNSTPPTGPTTGQTSGTPGVPGADAPVGTAEPSQPRVLPQNKSAMGRDEFLKMLVAQLKNQDPLNPMDGKDMAAQLAQFSTVEQLIQMNKSIEAQASMDQEIVDALGSLEETQNARADELASLIEGQMAMATVGKIGVTTGNTTFVDRTGSGSLVIDTGGRTGPGRVTITNAKGETVGTMDVGQVPAGMQSFDTKDFYKDPPLPPGKYSFSFEVATDGGQWQQVKTYTSGRITGLKYDQGNPILIIGDQLQMPMSQLTQIRG